MIIAHTLTPSAVVVLYLLVHYTALHSPWHAQFLPVHHGTLFVLFVLTADTHTCSAIAAPYHGGPFSTVTYWQSTVSLIIFSFQYYSRIFVVLLRVLPSYFANSHLKLELIS